MTWDSSPQKHIINVENALDQSTDYIQSLEVLLGRIAEITDSDNTLEVKHMRIAQLLKKTGWVQ